LYVSQAELLNKKIRTVPSFSILATCIGEFSLTAINKTPVVINQQIQAYSFFKKQNIYFIRYQVQSSKTKEYFERFATETTIRYINKEKFALTPLIIPPLDEQKTIATYLDTKTAQIDRKIDLLTQKAQRYEELKKSLINETVTRGLDKSVPMKDSGIEWIGEIPEHWVLKRLKDVASITRGAILRPVNEPSYFDKNGQWHYLNISDVTKCDKYLYTAKLRLSDLGSKKSARVEPDNIVLTASATIGKPTINKIKVCVHDGFIPFKQIKTDIDYLYYFLLNRNIYNSLGKSNTQKNIYLDEVKM
jgi:type I restriction enzyme S subunit